MGTTGGGGNSWVRFEAVDLRMGIQRKSRDKGCARRATLDSGLGDRDMGFRRAPVPLVRFNAREPALRAPSW